MGKLSDEEKMGVKAGMVVAGILSTFALRYVEPTRKSFLGDDVAELLRRDARVLAEETTKGLTEEQKAAVVASFNEGVAKKTN